MILKDIVKYGLIFFVISLALLSRVSASENQVGCQPSLQEKVEQYRFYILSGDVEGLSGSINYPVKALIGGSIVNIRDKTVLSAVWKSIITERFLEVVSSSDACVLVEELNLDPFNQKIKSLAIFHDSVDSKYGYSGISSEKALLDFLNTVVTLASNKDYQRLSNLFKYPFAVQCGDKDLTINDQLEFNKYADCIISDRFIGIVKKSLAEESFVQNPKGLMLNGHGDVWVIEVYGSLLLQPVNI